MTNSSATSTRKRTRAEQRLADQFPGTPTPEFVTADQMAKALCIGVHSLADLAESNGVKRSGTDAAGALYRASDLHKLGDAILPNIQSINWTR